MEVTGRGNENDDCSNNDGIFSAKKPIKTLDDLKGFKMRVPLDANRNRSKPWVLPPRRCLPAKFTWRSKRAFWTAPPQAREFWSIRSGLRSVKYGLEGWVAEANAQDIVVNHKAWDAIPNDIKEIVAMVFQALGQKQRAMAIMPGMSNHWRRQCEALGVQVSSCPHKTIRNLRKCSPNQWFSDLEKANPRTKEAWDIVKQFTKQKK